MRSLPFVVVVATVITAAHARADAILKTCDDPATALSGLVIPAEGTQNAPSNVTPFVGDGQGSLELALLDPQGNTVQTTLQQLGGNGGLGPSATLTRLVPAGPLGPGNFTIVANGAAITHFTVGNDADTTAPGAATATASGGVGCNGSASAEFTVGVATNDAVLFIGVVNGEPTIGAGARIDGASATNQLTVFGTGSATANIAGVDLAGNVGVSTPVEVTFPEVAGLPGCSSSGAPVSLLSALAFLGLANIRRHIHARVGHRSPTHRS